MSKSEIAAAMDDLLAINMQAVVPTALRSPPTRIKYSPNRLQELTALMSRATSIRTPLPMLGVPHIDDLSDKQRAKSTKFETLFLECLSRGSICSTKLKVEYHRKSGSAKTDLRPNSKSVRMLTRLLRQDDCTMNPYLTWSRHEVMAALKQRQLSITGLETKSRFARRINLQAADERRAFRFMDLPKEVRILIYEDAVLKEVDWVVQGSPKPALLSLRICGQGLFDMPLSLSDHTPSSLGLYKAELQWFTVMGADNLAKVRHLSFISRFSLVSLGQKTELDLLCLKAATCPTVVGTACSCGKGCGFRTRLYLGEEVASQYKQLENAKSIEYVFISPEMTQDAIRQIESLKMRIANLQEAMEKFGRLCGTHKRVKPSAEGLVLLARAVYLECSD
ncbi:hypothetical protein E4T43_02015 [Aureobasidium subglaciale]|nr:hypothetical protein E4T43_02015 [Aureobasidium subglaciale]